MSGSNLASDCLTDGMDRSSSVTTFTSGCYNSSIGSITTRTRSKSNDSFCTAMVDADHEDLSGRVVNDLLAELQHEDLLFGENTPPQDVFHRHTNASLSELECSSDLNEKNPATSPVGLLASLDAGMASLGRWIRSNNPAKSELSEAHINPKNVAPYQNQQRSFSPVLLLESDCISNNHDYIEVQRLMPNTNGDGDQYLQHLADNQRLRSLSEPEIRDHLIPASSISPLQSQVKASSSSNVLRSRSKSSAIGSDDYNQTNLRGRAYTADTSISRLRRRIGNRNVSTDSQVDTRSKRTSTIVTTPDAVAGTVHYRAVKRNVHENIPAMMPLSLPPWSSISANEGPQGESSAPTVDHVGWISSNPIEQTRNTILLDDETVRGTNRLSPQYVAPFIDNEELVHRSQNATTISTSTVRTTDASNTIYANIPSPHLRTNQSEIDHERLARIRWMRINRRFQLLIAIVALIFSLLLLAIFICWIALTSTYVLSWSNTCDDPLKKYYWLVTFQLILDIFRSDIMRFLFRWDNQSNERIPGRVVAYNIGYIIYALSVLQFGIRSVITPDVCSTTAHHFYSSSVAFVSLSIAAWATIVFGYIVPFCIVAILLTMNGYSPYASSLNSVDGEGSSQLTSFPMIPAAYATSGAPPGCVDKLTIRSTQDVPNICSKECCICMEGFTHQDVIVETNCRHLFHKNCCREWLRQARTCPVCRDDIPSTLEMVSNSNGGAGHVNHENNEDNDTRRSDSSNGQSTSIPIGPSGRPIAGLLHVFRVTRNHFNDNSRSSRHLDHTSSPVVNSTTRQNNSNATISDSMIDLEVERRSSAVTRY